LTPQHSISAGGGDLFRNIGAAVSDLGAGLQRWPLWQHFAWEVIREQYRRSIIGIFWITMTTAIFIGIVGALFGQVMHMRSVRYLPHLAVGYVVWQLIVSLITQSGKVFSQKSSFILSSTLPLSTYVYEMVWRSLIAFIFSAIVLVVVLVVYRVPVTPSFPFFLVGLALIAVNGIFVALILGIVCLRFRDVTEMVASLMRIAFFLTPILWEPGMLRSRAYIAEFNPFTHFVALVRDPLLGTMPTATTFVVCFVLTFGLGAFSLSFFGRYRPYVPIWL
jgi:ABC-type polysaccharide/polyol phosphate export permease